MNKVFPINTMGRDFVIGDLHGCYELFLLKLNEIDFDYTVDRMFSVGDLVDRGEQSLECLQLINKPWFHAVRGNHENMMIDVILLDEEPSLWLINGGMWSLNVDKDVLFALVNKASLLPHSITVKTTMGDIGICHAEAPTLDWNDVIAPNDNKVNYMLWSRYRIENNTETKVANVDLTIHGHTVLNVPTQLGNCLFIDTGAVFTGNLTCKELT